MNINYGILNEEISHNLFEEINRQPHCVECQTARNQFKDYDMKFNQEIKKQSYSNLLPGFSSEKVSVPIDVLIIAEAHGGGREETFRDQKSLEEEVKELGDYYLKKEMERFHQSEMRKLLTKLNEKNKIWVFTDLIKCFVWQFNKKEKNLKGSENRKIAIDYCSIYLDNQIENLQPKLILSLGQTVAKKYFKLEADLIHGKIYEMKKLKILYSIFPSRNTSDLWIKYGGWKEIINQIN